MDPADAKSANIFSNSLALEPSGQGINSFKIKLIFDGTVINYLGQDSGQWAILTPEKEALTLEFYPYGGVNYYRIKGTSSYMSVNSNAYVAFYSWSGATGFTREGKNLRADYNNHLLSFYSIDNGYIYAWNKYNILDVDLVDA